jgi:hypothetical protein
MRRQTMADMSNEQAARVLTKEADGWGDERVLFGTYLAALRMGAAALREKAERERGCEWCAVTCYVCVRGADGGCGYWANCSRANVKHEDYPHDQDLYKPKPYCDRCGRKLKEDVHD